jgi:hypothetical protein
MVEKACLYSMNNFTAVLQCVLLWYKKKSEYGNFPYFAFSLSILQFILLHFYSDFSVMFLGQTIDVQSYISHIDKLAAQSV